MTGTYIILAILTLLIFFSIEIHKGLINLKKNSEKSLADIYTHLKQRYDLIPTIIDTIKKYEEINSLTLKSIDKARKATINATTQNERIQAENQLTETLKTLFTITQNYPILKTDQNFIELQSKLENIEEKIQLSCRYYNATVRDYNMRIAVFPNIIFAKLMRLKSKNFFESKQKSNH